VLESGEILGCDRFILERGAIIEELFTAWIMLTWMLALTTICFAIEIISKALCFGLCSKSNQN